MFARLDDRTVRSRCDVLYATERNQQGQRRMLLMYAFAAEISNNIEIEALRERIDDMIKRRLKGELSCCENCVFQCSTPKEYDFKIDLSKI